MWTKDGKNVVLQQEPEGGFHLNLFLAPADGSRPPERLTKSDKMQQPGGFTPDGRTLVYQQGWMDEGSYEIWMLPLDTRKPVPVVASHKGDLHPALSPDGRWLTYATKESGKWEVMVRPFPGPGSVTQVSTESGWAPPRSKDGRQIYYQSREGSPNV